MYQTVDHKGAEWQPEADYGSTFQDESHFSPGLCDDDQSRSRPLPRPADE